MAKLAAAAIILCFLAACSPAKKVIKLNEVQNFEPGAPSAMLFLTFELSRKGKKETARLVKSFAASGKVKDMNPHIHGSSKIETLIYYSHGGPAKTISSLHPLYNDSEVFSEDGTIKKVTETASSGSLTLRIPLEKDMEMIRLFSIHSGHPPKKLFTVELVP